MAQSTKAGAKPPRAFDVIAPGKTAPTASARPIIVTNRPMIHDPMAPIETPKAETPQLEASRIAKPLHMPSTPAPAAQTDSPKSKEAMPTTDKPEQSAEPPAATAVTHTSEPPSEAKPSDVVSAPDKVTQQKIEHERAARTAQQEQIITSKQYYLPIKLAEQQRSTRRAVILLVVVLLGVCIWLDLVLDARIVHLGPLRALTHFFDTMIHFG